MKKRRVDPLSVPVRYRLLPLHIVETTELFLGTIRTRYLQEIKNMIFGREVR